MVGSAGAMMVCSSVLRNIASIMPAMIDRTAAGSSGGGRLVSRRSSAFLYGEMGAGFGVEFELGLSLHAGRLLRGGIRVGQETMRSS
jgi:hypothetical protein